MVTSFYQRTANHVHFFSLNLRNLLYLIGIHAHNAEFYIEDNNNQIEVGKHTCFAGHIHLACTEGTAIKIGEKCLFSSDIVIRTGDSHAIYDLQGKRKNLAQDVTIGNHVWIAYRTLINKGTVLQSESVVGTGSVVTKAFCKSNVVIAGVPARIVEENVCWNENRSLN